jgi:hypothetical protein
LSKMEIIFFMSISEKTQTVIMQSRFAKITINF